MGKRVDRFHKDIFFPSSYESSMKTFVEEIVALGPLTFSRHAIEKVVDYTFEYGKNFFQQFIKTVSRNSLDPEKVFEYYAAKTGKITKACFRYTFDEYPVDIIMVISANGVVITMYVANKNDNHSTLNKNLYKKGE